MSLFNNSIFLLNDGTVKACGDSSKYQLFISAATIKDPIKLNIENAVHFSIGMDYVMFLLNDGTVKCCGNNVYEQLGLGDTTDRNTPTLIPNLENVKQITYIDIILKYCMRKNGNDFIYKNDAHIELNKIENLYEFGMKSCDEICKQYLEKEKNNDIKIKKLIKEE